MKCGFRRCKDVLEDKVVVSKELEVYVVVIQVRYRL